MNEMNKLIKLLAKADIPFEVRGQTFPDLDAARNGKGFEKKAYVQIISPSEEDWKIDAIWHPGSYGYESGLLEIMGPSTEEYGDGVVGSLTAGEALEYFKRAVG